MTMRTLAVVVLVVLTGGPVSAASQSHNGDSRHPPIRTIGPTTVVGESDPDLWKSVLDLLPARPERIEVLDLEALSGPTRQKLRGLDAFVLGGQTTLVVIRQGATLRQAEYGDAFDRLVLASLVWHEMAHANGLDERAALDQEAALWRRFISTGLVDGGVGLTYIARLREVAAGKRKQFDGVNRMSGR
jgi:hypothetical protein